MDSREKQLIRNTGIIGMGTIAPRLTSIITLPVVTAGLSQAEFGTYDLVVTMTMLLMPLVTLEIEFAAFRFLIDCRNNEKKIDSIISTTICFSIPIVVLVGVLVFFLLVKFRVTTRILVCTFFITDVLLSEVQQIIRGLALNELFSKSTILRSVINLGMILYLILWKRQGMNAMLMAATISSAVAIVFVLIKSKIWKSISIGACSKTLLVSMIGYSWPIIPSTLSFWVLNTSDRLVITGFLGIEAVAIYAAANKIPSILNIVNGIFALSWQENASLSAKDEDAGEYYSAIFERLLRVACGCTSIVLAFVPLLFRLLIRGEYGDGYQNIPILMLAILFSIIAAFLGGIYVAYKKTRSVGFTTIIAAVINLLVDFVLINKIGIYAASLSTLISYVSLCIFRFIDVGKRHRIRFRYNQICGYLVVLGIMSLLCAMRMQIYNVLNIVIGIVFAAAINRYNINEAIKMIGGKIK